MANSSSPGTEYTFTTQHPPRMQDIHAIPIDIPPTDLETTMGVAEFAGTPGVEPRHTFPVGAGGLVVEEGPKTVQITVTRKKSWVLTDAPRHFAVDNTIHITRTKGYTKTDENRIFSNCGGGCQRHAIWIQVKRQSQSTAHRG